MTLFSLLKRRNSPASSPTRPLGYWKVIVERPVRIDGIGPDRAYSAKELKEIRGNNTTSESAHPVIRKIHRSGTSPNPLHGLFSEEIDGKQVVVEYHADSELRDTEQVPLLEDGGIDAFIEREVLRYTSDAWYDPGKVKVGYEINFNRYFYKPEPLRSLEEIRADILALEQESDGLLEEIVGTTNTP